MGTEEEIRALKEQYGEWLLRHPGVTGVGIRRAGRSGFVLAVYLDSDRADRNRLPDELDGHRITYIAASTFRRQ